MLTDKGVRAAKAADKPVRHYDTGGLYLEVSKTGAKLWRLKYYFHGREKRISLGIYPQVTLAAARQARDQARQQLRGGVDPGAAARRARSRALGQSSFESVARDWHKTKNSNFAPATAAAKMRRLELMVFPFVGNRELDDIEPQEWLAVLRRIEDRGVIETAHRVRALCGEVYRYARVAGLAKTDPLRDLQGILRPPTGRHFASQTEPAGIKRVLAAIDGYSGTVIVRPALLLAPLVFVRPGELRSMRWADVNLDAAEWRFTATKTKTPHIVPLSRQALAILKDMNGLTGAGEFVFPALRGNDKCISNNTLNAALKTLGIDTHNEFTTHGWRAAARTMLEERLGFRPEIIELQLAHTVRDPLGRAYNRTTHLEERRRMMQAWADYLDELRREHAAEAGRVAKGAA